MAILKKYIGNDQVGATKILLENNSALRAANSSGTSEDLLKLDASSVLQFLKLPRVSSDPTHPDDIVRQSYLESSINLAKTEVENRIAAEEARAAAEEARLQQEIDFEEQRALAAEAAIDFKLDQEIARAQAKEAEIEASVATKIPLAYIGAANGVTPLGADSKIPSQYLPAVAITDVFVVTTLAQRDALVPASVQTGDVVKVTEAITSADGTKLSRTYIYDGSVFVELNTESDVDSVAGKVGHVTLDTRDVVEFGDYRYYTPAREQAARDYVDAEVFEEKQERMAEDLTFLKLDGSRPMESELNMGGYRIEDLASPIGPLDAANKGYVDQEVSSEAAIRAAEDLTFLKHDGSRPLTGTLQLDGHDITGIDEVTGFSGAAIKSGSEIDMQSHKITNLADPMAAQDAATKAYVDMQVTEGVNDLLGQPNGIATLDGSGKVPVTQLPNSIMQYQGMWNAATNTPLLSNTGNFPEDLGNVYRVSAAGSVDFGAGSISFEEGDYVILGVVGWEKSDGTDQVLSVNGQQGIVVLDTSHIMESGDYRYYTPAREQAAKDYVDGQLDMLQVSMPEYEALELSSQDIANGYIDLQFAPAKPPVVVRQGLVGRYGPNALKRDFTFSGTRITFVNEWAVGGLTQIEVGDLVEVRYQRTTNPYV